VDSDEGFGIERNEGCVGLGGSLIWRDLMGSVYVDVVFGIREED
jgi:hypothetical protein